MKQPSVYLKMRVLGAVDTVEGRTRHERILHVASMTFLDGEANPRQFIWRTNEVGGQRVTRTVLALFQPPPPEPDRHLSMHPALRLSHS